MGMGTVRRISVESAVMRALYSPVVVKKERRQKVKHSIPRPVYIPTFIYGHKFWVETKRVRPWIQMAEMSFLHRVSRLSLKDRVGSLDIRRGVRLETPRRASRAGSGIWSECILDAPLVRGYSHLPPGEHPQEDPGYSGGTMFLD
uniref:PPUP9356 n=1 Tax=Poeciliopsis prolifica TaxID=188132 RepID=A0A0S7ESH0_9TELE